MRKQPVDIGRTQSGIPGLFTNNYLAMTLSEEQYAALAGRPDRLTEFAAERGFEYRPMSEAVLRTGPL